MSGTHLFLSSGYEVEVTSLPPYYIDFLEDVYPYKEMPKRTMKLMSGEVVPYAYEPPEYPPDASNEEEMGLYLKYLDIVAANDNIRHNRERARRDFLLLNCVHVLNGPAQFTDPDWADGIEAAVPGYKVPTGRNRLLAFLKSQVIITEQEYSSIIQICLYPEVDMQSILSALRGFPAQMGQS